MKIIQFQVTASEAGFGNIYVLDEAGNLWMRSSSYSLNEGDPEDRNWRLMACPEQLVAENNQVPQ
jgi:hypothetical protein